MDVSFWDFDIPPKELHFVHVFECYLSVCRIRRNIQYGKSSALQTEFTMFLWTTISYEYINVWNWNTWACNRKNTQCMIIDGWIDGWKGCMRHGWMELSCRHMFSWNVTFFSFLPFSGTVWHVSTPINPQTLLTSPLPLALSSRLLGTKSGVGSKSKGMLVTARGQGPCLSALLLASWV